MLYRRAVMRSPNASSDPTDAVLVITSDSTTPRSAQPPTWMSARNQLPRRPATLHTNLTLNSAAPHRPLRPPQPVQLRRQRPGAVLQILQVAVAVERPAVDAARPAAPVAGLRGARTGVIGPGPAGAPAALVDPRSGLDADLPGPARLPAAHQASPPLAWLPGSDQPTKHARTPSRSSIAPTVLPGGGACRTGSGVGWRPEGATAV